MRVRRIILAVFLGTALVLGGWTWWSSRLVDRIVARHAREVEGILRDLESADARRPVAFGEPMPGDAWDFYYRAEESLSEMPDEEQSIIPELRNPEEDRVTDASGLERVYSKYSTVVDSVRQGLLRERCAPRLLFQLDYWGDFRLTSNSTDQVTRFLLRESLLRHEQGRDGEALDRLTLILGWAQDHARGEALQQGGRYKLLRCEERAVAAAHALFEGHSLAAVDLETAARHLDILEASRPRILDAIQRDCLQLRISLLKGFESLREKGFAERDLKEGKWALSGRALIADALEQIEVIERRFSGIRDLTPQCVEEAARAIEADVVAVAASCRMEVWIWRPDRYVNFLQADAESRFWLSQLRLAVAVAWFESVNGHLPEKTESLVPKFLRSAPLCPGSGEAIRYEAGKVWCPDHPKAVWRISRKA